MAEGVEKFDYIVHDVFTGGAEPVDLFTVEFISNLKALLTPNGVVAIVSGGANFIYQRSMLIAFRTLQETCSYLQHALLYIQSSRSSHHIHIHPRLLHQIVVYTASPR